VIDCTKFIYDVTGDPLFDAELDGKDEDGNPKVKKTNVPLGKLLARLVGNSKVEGEDAVTMTAIAFKLHDGGKKLELAEEDIARILKAVEASEIPIWVEGGIRHLISPLSIKDEEHREIFAKMYKNGNGNGKGK